MAGQVYWLGADGNIYLKGASGVQNVGQPFNGASSLKDGGFDSRQISAQATRIADPNPPQQSAVVAPAPSNPNGSSAPAALAKVDKSNEINLATAGLGAVDAQYNSGIASIDKALGSLTGQYDTETGRNEKSYTDNSNSNQNNLQKNKQTALVNAAQGRQGLFGTLSSLGALSGDGINLANRAVQKGANDDLSGAADNFSTNQSNLDTSIGTYRDEDKARRENASIAAENAKTNAANSAAKDRLGYYGQLVNAYSAMGDEGNAKTFTDKAAGLYPELAKTAVPNSNIAYSGAAFTPGSLANYMAGADSTVVNATPTQGGVDIPGLVAAPTKKKQLQTV